MIRVEGRCRSFSSAFRGPSPSALPFSSRAGFLASTWQTPPPRCSGQSPAMHTTGTSTKIFGTSELDAARPRLDVVAAAVDLIARLHTRAAGSALLAECQQHLDDLGMRYFASNVSEAIVKLEALSAAEHGFTDAERRVRTCLITRLNQLLDSLPRRTEFMRRCGGPYTLLHGDLWTINTVVVAGPEGPRARLIDWDRIGVGPISYDLSTFLYRFPAADRSAILEQYRTAVALAGWHLPSDSDLNVLFETAECARYASRVIWPAVGLLEGTAEWGHWELAQILGWFEALEPVIPQ